MPEFTAFKELDQKKESVIVSTRAIEKQLLIAYDERRARGEFFVIFAVSVSLTLLIIVALLFDYLIVLNFVVTRVVLWCLLSTVIIGVGRFIHAWVFELTRSEREIHTIHAMLTAQIHAIEQYEKGVIDPEGIRLLYGSVDTTEYKPTLYMNGVTEIVDWFIFTLLALAILLLALIFI